MFHSKFLPMILYFIKSRLTICISIMLLVTAAGCRKFVEVDAPIESIDVENVFSSDATAIASITGMYSRMVNNQDFFSDVVFSLYPSLLADELNSSAANNTRDPFQNNTLPVTNGIVANNFWRRGFELLYHANSCIEGLEKTALVTDSVKKQLLGEARFMRSFIYFNLVNLFGDVPLQTSTDYKVNQALPRTGIGNIYALIISDLKYAADNLKPYSITKVKIRPCKEVAYALLSKAYLYLSDWSHAEEYSGKVITSGNYTLLNNLQNVFLLNSEEVIWQFESTASTNLIQQAVTYVPAAATTRPPIIVTKGLLSAFEANDKRKTNWLKSNTVSSAIYFYPYKYKVRSGTNTTESIALFRLAEQMLIRAEARARQKKLYDAIADINLVRDRAGVLLLPYTLTEDEVFKYIEQERRIELMFEWGNRWYDLKRTGRADAVLGALKGMNWQSTDVLLPIPNAERLLNPALEQNDGYLR